MRMREWWLSPLSADVEICAELPYSRSTQNGTCGILFAHRNDSVDSVTDIPDGSVVLSEYPNLTRKFFAIVIGKEEVNRLIPPLLKLGAEGPIIMPITSVIQSW